MIARGWRRCVGSCDSGWPRRRFSTPGSLPRTWKRPIARCGSDGVRKRPATRPDGGRKRNMAATPNLAETLAIATSHHQAGRLAEAEQIYRRILLLDPGQPHALHQLG